MASAPQPGLPHAAYERFEGIGDYDVMLDELIRQTQRVIRIFDPSLAPSFNTENRCALLRGFLRANPSNRLFVVVHKIDGIDRICPRFVTLLQQFSHAAKVRQTPRWAHHVCDPFAIFDASHYLRRFHHAHMRYGRGLNELEGAQQLLDRHGEMWEASKTIAVASVLGL